MKPEPSRHELAPLQVLAPLPAGPQPYGWNPAPPPEDAPGLLTLADHLLQHVRLFVGIVALALILGVIYLVITPPLWQADTLVQVDAQGPRPMARLNPQQAAPDAPPAGFVQGELEILRSREIVAPAIAKTGADVDVSVYNRIPVIGPWYARTVGRDAREPLPPPFGWSALAAWSWGGESLTVTKVQVPPSRYGQPMWLVAGQNGQWTLRDEDDSALASGSVGAAVPFKLDGSNALLQVGKMAARPGTRFQIVPNDPVAVYDAIQRNLKVEEAGRQSGVIRLSLTDNDARFARDFLDALTGAYLQHHLKVSTSEASRALTFLDSQLPVIKKELDRAEEALNQYRTGNSTLNVGVENETALRRLADLERERVGIEMRRQQLSERYTPQYPEVAALQRQLSTLAGETLRLRGQMQQAPRQDKDIVRLQRDVQVNTQLYTALLANAQELRIAQAGMSGNARLVDPAGVQSQPVKPRAGTVMSVATGLGLVAALVSVLLARLVRPTLRTSEDLERHSGHVTLAALPESPRQRLLMRGPRLWRQRLQQRLLAVHAPTEPAVEGLRALRNAIALQDPKPDGEGRSVLITAPTSAAGKSFVASNLAVLMAAADRRVLLVDLDLRAPRQHTYFGINRDRLGLADVMAGRCSLNDAIVVDAMPGLDLLLTGHVSQSPGELLLRPRFELLLAEWRRHYAHVVLDSAPVLPVGDTLAIGRLADSTYLVVRSEDNTQHEVQDALRRLQGVGAKIEGLVLNGVKRGRLATMPYRGYFPQDPDLHGAH
jgi:tyrosine-protein kinase Etk/Wzc